MGGQSPEIRKQINRTCHGSGSLDDHDRVPVIFHQTFGLERFASDSTAKALAQDRNKTKGLKVFEIFRSINELADSLGSRFEASLWLEVE